MKTKNVTYIIGDTFRMETSSAAPFRKGPAGWGHRARPGLSFIADEKNLLTPVWGNEDIKLRIADDKMVADLAAVDAEIAAAEETARALRAKRQQILRDGVDRCHMVPAPGGKTNYDFESDEV